MLVACTLPHLCPSDVVLLPPSLCRRCIGEGYTHVSSHIDFKSWYENELQPQLETRLSAFLAGTQDLIASVLQARALWLVGVCGQVRGEWNVFSVHGFL